MSPSSLARRLQSASVVVLVALLCGAAAARAEDAGAAAPAADPRTAQIHALIAGTLDVAVDPRSLFTVSLDDENAVQVEAVRLRALLRAVDESAWPPPSRPKRSRSAAPVPPAVSTRAAIETLDPARWCARVDLDRARLEFCSLPPELREETLRVHAARQEAARPRETEEERRAREAEVERQKALDAARAARSEAERLVAGELTRLASIEQSVASIRSRFGALRDELAARRDALLGWQRRVRDAKVGKPAAADATYDALRKSLRASRGELETALTALASPTSDVPALPPDPLADVPVDVPTDQVRARRLAVSRLVEEARVDEQSLREARAAQLLDEISALNRERLGLLPSLSSGKRAAITGFTEAGWDQARSELRHLRLILRYHRHVAMESIRSLRGWAGLRGAPLFGVAAFAVPWLICVGLFVRWRRRSRVLLALAERRLARADLGEGPTSTRAARRALRLVTGVHRPLEWLLLVAATVWLLPAATRGLLEVQLLTVVIGWSLGGALIVNAINTLARHRSGATSTPEHDVGGLRLRSLRLVGRVAVAFVVILRLTASLVGEGTLHSWVLSTCWVAAVAVFLLLVRWWRETVFTRIDRSRKKSRLQAWALANRTGWKSFFAAMAAAVHLFALGSFRVVKRWLASFTVARRAHAYLFKREIDRLAAGTASGATLPLRQEAYASLSPDDPGSDWVPCVADKTFERLLRRATEREGGIVAVIGGRGLGKSWLLRRLQEAVPDSVALGCASETSPRAIQSALEWRPPSESPGGGPRLVLLDDVNALVRPVLGGLAPFDDLLASARARSASTLWVLAIDAVVWPFLRRARDGRPLFDDVIVLDGWTEGQIGDLLLRRSARAGVTPTFEGLLERLPPLADEIDRQEALDAKREAYFRLIWDYASGNPGMALQVWRSSLVEDREGQVAARALQAPDLEQLERLPDPALFILRAVLQLAPATIEDVARATRVNEAQVDNVFRFGQAHGYLADDGGRVRVTWDWLRAVYQILERRHLLVRP